jgi:DUF1680 family protein
MKRVTSIALCVAAGTVAAGQEPGSSPWALLKVGEVRPEGWLKRQMQLDLREGIAGHYDQISDNVSQNLFASQQREPGSMIPGSRGINEKAWWAGEHEGYWMDGLIRMAILTGSRSDLQRAQSWVDQILARFDETGYIGIYSPETRFPDKGFDGELWTQSRAFQGLLAWVEHTGDARVLSAVEQTVHKTIDHYRAAGTYFKRDGVDGGVTHAVGYMDTLEWLWRLTGDRYYADAAVWLYTDFCRYPKADMSCAMLLNKDALWREHTPHTAEGLYMPAVAGCFSGNADFINAAEQVPVKLARHTNPGGGFAAGKLESIAQTYGGGDVNAEYCAMTEGILSLNRLFLYQGDLFSGDWSEQCALNAAQGARFHPANTGVIYLSRDNRKLAAEPGLHGGREIFSAAHRTAACCTLNSIRLLPAYVEGMWFRSTREPKLLANLYGACEVTTDIGGQPVRIVEETDYPFSDRIVFRINPDAPVRFELMLRVPPNSGAVRVDTDPSADVEQDDRQIRITKTWAAGDTVTVDFDFQVVRRTQHDGKQVYWQRGPLVFALPLPSTVSELKEIENAGQKTGFYDWEVTPQSEKGWDFLLDPASKFSPVFLNGNSLEPWGKPMLVLKGSLLTRGGETAEVTLMPLGSTTLRRTTFPVNAAAVLPDGVKESDHFSDEDDPMRKF